MVSFFATAATVALALFSVANAQSTSADDYYRPDPSITSGFPGNTDAPFRRTPCPALNTLANHGFLPRNGQNVTKEQIREAIITQFNIAPILADTVTKPLPAVFDLNFLGTHGFIEHDVSLSRIDSYFGTDQSQADPTLLQDLLKRAETQPIDVKMMAQIHKDRRAVSVATNPKSTFGAKETQTAFGEAGLALVRLGDSDSVSISRARIESFFVHEKFPGDWKTPATVLTIPDLLNVGNRVLNIVMGYV